MENLKKCCWELIEQLPYPLFLLDSEGNCLGATRGARFLLFGEENTAVEKDAFIKLFDDETRQVIISDVKSTAELNVPFRIEEVQLKWKNNEMAADIEFFALSETLFPGKQILALVMDATPRVAAYKAMITSRINYKFLLDNSPDYIFVWNKEGNCVYVNSMMTKLVQRSENELVGGRVESLFENKNNYIASNVKKVFKTAKECQSNIELFTVGGQTYWMELRLFPLLSEENSVMYVLGVLRDFTEKMQAEKKMAYAARFETMGKLISSAIHDLNNQLGGIFGALELLPKCEDKQNQSKYLNIIDKSANRAKEIVATLLNYSKKTDETFSSVDIHAIINEIITMLEMVIPTNNIAIRQMLYANPSLVCGNAGQIQNAILNLVLNARDAMPAGGELAFSTSIVFLTEDFCSNSAPGLKSGRYIQISVRDTGKGIPEENLQKIFEPFFTTKGKHGSGMGLASVKNAVEKHRGIITVESVPDKGSDFKIYLPLSDETEKAPGPELTVKKHDFSANVMIIEDEALIRSLTVNMLKHLGCEAVVFETAREALEYYKSHTQKIDVILLDLMIPETDGLTLLKELYNINRSIKAIVMSGYIPEMSCEELLKSGCKALLKKPFKITDLSNALAKALEEKTL
jgi:PAS domain S-box-containing protein